MDFSTKIMIIIGVFIGGALIVGVIWGSVISGRLSELKEAFTKLGLEYPDNPEHALFDNGNRKGLVLMSEQLIVRVTFENDQYKLKKLAPEDILSVEVFEDGGSITKSNTGSAAGRAVLGGLVLGPIGLVAGLTGQKVTTDLVSRIDFRVVLNDIMDPLFDLNLLTNFQPEKKGIMYDMSMTKARTWHGRLSAFMNQQKGE